MQLQSFTLQIFEPEKTLSFYINVLGFKLVNEISENGSIYYDLCFENTNLYLQLKHNPTLDKVAYQQEPTDNYWKYSIFVDDIQRVYKALQKQKHVVGKPYQFEDIGYLAHTTDLENHQIEFIQSTFEKNTPKTKPDTSYPLLENPKLGLITIRTKDPIKSIGFFEDILDLKLLVRMYVKRGNGFTLYFLGDRNLNVPNKDIDAVENREWMYQQSHWFIEIQHYWGSEYNDDFALKSTFNNGLKRINFSGDLGVLKDRLVINNIPFRQENDKIIFETVDKHEITLTKI